MFYSYYVCAVLDFFWFPIISYNQNVSSISAHVGTLKVNVKCTLVQVLRLCTGRTACRRNRGIALLFLDHGTRRGDGQCHAPASLYPWERPGTHCNRRLGGPQGRSGQVRKISPPPGFDPRTVQHVGSRYTKLPDPYVATVTGTIYKRRVCYYVLPLLCGASSSMIGFLEAVNSCTFGAQLGRFCS